MKKTHLTTNLFGQEIFSKDYSLLLNILSSHLKKHEKTLSVFTPNSEQLVLAKKEKSFAKSLGFADILIPDGVGLLFASKILAFFGKIKKSDAIFERITGIDLTKKLLSIAKKNGLRVLIVGGRGYEGRKYDNQKVEILGLKNEFGEKDPIWWVEGYSKVDSPTVGESKAINSVVSQIKPDLVFVAFGAPNQEKWIVENKHILERSGVSIVMVVGGTFDVLFGKVGRAPKWMQNLGLEWLHRLLKEPWRWRRQLRLLEFIRLTIREIFN